MLLLIAFIISVLYSAIELFAVSKQKFSKKSITALLANAYLIPLFSVMVWKYLLLHKHFLLTDAFTSTDYIIFSVISLIVGAIVILLKTKCRKLAPEADPGSKKTTGRKITATLLFFLGVLCISMTIWGKIEYGDMPVDQLLINFLSPVSGAASTDFFSAYEGPLLATIALTTIFVVLIYSDFRYLFVCSRKPKTGKFSVIRKNAGLWLAILVFIGGLAYGTYQLELVDICKAYMSKSDIIDRNYVDPRDANIQFPEKKRNLIHIFLESMEFSYMSKDLGGFMDVNMIPELTQLAGEGYCFSHSDNQFGGPQAAVGTTWSVASMVNMSTGLPLKTPTERNAYGSKDNFLPGAYTMGDLLAEQGYEQTLMFGADADFGGLTYYFESHGDFKIMDYKYAKNNGLIPKNYMVWWGYEDDKLFEFAKDELTRLGQTGKPFNFVMETADTHRPDGYLSPNAPTPYENQYANVVAYSSAEVYDFVRWIQQQPFYENTTVVITGDHLSMETNFFEFYKFDDDYRRTQYNVILNPVGSVETDDLSILRNRDYANFDMFPTILSSMGVTFDGSRLGIGTDLFSGEQTLFEEYGFEDANSELERMSLFYNTHILKKAE